MALVFEIGCLVYDRAGDQDGEVIGVSNGTFTAGWPVVRFDYFSSTTGRPIRDEIPCDPEWLTFIGRKYK